MSIPENSYLLQGEDFAARIWRAEELTAKAKLEFPSAALVPANTPARMAAMASMDMFSPSRIVVSYPDAELIEETLAASSNIFADFLLVSTSSARAGAVPSGFKVEKFPLPSSTSAAQARVRLAAEHYGLSLPPHLTASLASAAKADLPRVDSALRSAALLDDTLVIPLLLSGLQAAPWPSEVLDALVRRDLPAALALCRRLPPNSLTPFLANQLGRASASPASAATREFSSTALSRAWKAVSLIPLWEENSNLLAVGAVYEALSESADSSSTRTMEAG